MRTRMMIMGLIIVAWTSIFTGIEVKAADSETVRSEESGRIEEVIESKRNELKELKEEGDELLEGIEDVEYSYTCIGYEIYDISEDYTLERGITVSVHYIYDAVDHETLKIYGIVNGSKRIDSDVMIKKYPEVWRF